MKSKNYKKLYNKYKEKVKEKEEGRYEEKKEGECVHFCNQTQPIDILFNNW